MAEKIGMIRWFLEELPKLRESGVIDSTAEESLQKHYQERIAAAPSLQKYFLLNFSIIGSVLIAGGIILLFNYNWDMFSKLTRILIAFLPIALGVVLSLYTLMASRSQSWREGSAILTSTGTAVLIALLSQIYHTGGTLSQFMTLVLLLALPLIYIFNSISLATLYMGALFMTPGSWYELNWLPMEFCLLLGILPFAGWHLLREKSPYQVWMRYLVMGFAVFGIMAFGGGYSRGVILFTVCAVFMLASLRLQDRGERMFCNPWLLASFFFLLVLMSFGTYTGGWILRLNRHGEASGILYFWLMEGGFLLVFLFLFIRDYLRKQVSFQHFMMLFLILVAFLGILLEVFNVSKIYMCFVMILYMGVFGVTLLMRGWRKNSMLAFNGGLLTWALLIGLRFFDAKIGLQGRAIAFIVFGLGFICANLFFSYKLGRIKSTEVNHAEQ